MQKCINYQYASHKLVYQTKTSWKTPQIIDIHDGPVENRDLATCFIFLDTTNKYHKYLKIISTFDLFLLNKSAEIVKSAPSATFYVIRVNLIFFFFFSSGVLFTIRPVYL